MAKRRFQRVRRVYRRATSWGVLSMVRKVQPYIILGLGLLFLYPVAKEWWSKKGQKMNEG